MRPQQVVRELTALAREAGADVRIERFGPRAPSDGGLCQLEGRPVILVDERLGALEQAGVLGLSLRALGLDLASIRPELRSYVRTGHAEIPRLMTLKPLARPRPTLVRIK